MMQKLPYHYKLYLSFSLIVTIILFASGTFFFQYNNRLLQNNLQSNSLDSLNLIQSRIEDMLVNVDKDLVTLHASKAFTDIVFHIPETPYNYFLQHPTITSDVDGILLSVLATTKANRSIHYISRYYDYLGTQINQQSLNSKPMTKDQIRDIPTVRDALTTKKYKLYFPPHPDYWSSDASLTLTVARPIRDTYHTYGVLEYNIEATELDELLKLPNSDDTYQLLLLDDSGKLLYHNIKDTSESRIRELYKDESFEQPIGYYYADKNSLMAYSHSELTGWTILIKRDIHTYTMQVNSMGKTIILSYIGAFIILLLFLFIITRNLTQPLRTLRNNLYHLELNQDIHLDIQSSNNEIVVLTSGIEEILNKMRLQNIHIMEIRERAVKAHFDAMEAQLNPHFLYNTLSVIGSYGLEQGNTTVPKMCTELANLLRYSINFNHRTVRLKDEFDNIKSYLYIMKMRHEHMLDYSWDLDSSLDDINVPKLILQPIIENCFQHGFQNVPPVWKIHIRSYRSENRWMVSVSNNGQPFNQDKIDQIYNRFDQFKKSFLEGREVENKLEQQGFGLENTILRLSIYYRGLEYFHIRTEEYLTTIEIGGFIDDESN